MKTAKYYADLIGNEYQNWKNEYIIFNGGTGTGKTYFCLNVLGTYASQNNKTITYICNRKELERQLCTEVNKLGLDQIIHVTNYQKLQSLIQQGESLVNTDYIIADECHYFTTDALFNDYTDLSYDYVMNAARSSTVILISATATMFFKYLTVMKIVDKNRVYTIPKDYSYVERLIFYSPKLIVNLINNILESEKDSKIVVFCNSAKRMKEMHEQYGSQASYFCSRYTNDNVLRKICDDNAIKDNTFKSRMLFTTSAADNGIDFKDRNIKYIFSELSDMDALIQSLGRKRPLDENDRCTFYVRHYTENGLVGLRNIAQKNVDIIDEYNKSPNAFIEKYKHDRNLTKKYDVLYQGYRNSDPYDIMINRQKSIKYRQNLTVYNIIIKQGFITTLIASLDYDYFSIKHTVINADNVPPGKSFIEKLSKFEGRKLFSEEQHEVRKLFKTDASMMLNIKGGNPTINVLNAALDQKCVSYHLRFVKMLATN